MKLLDFVMASDWLGRVITDDEDSSDFLPLVDWEPEGEAND